MTFELRNKESNITDQGIPLENIPAKGIGVLASDSMTSLENKKDKSEIEIIPIKEEC